MAKRAKRTNGTSALRTKSQDAYIGLRIRGARNLADKSQEWLGEQLGVTFQQIQKYEKGTNRVCAAKLALISCLLEQPISYFFEGIDTYGSKKAAGADSVAEFMAIPHAKDLVAAFIQINPSEKRAVLLATAKALAA